MIKLFSPTQILVGTFFGGPLAGMYFLYSNFEDLGDKRNSEKTIMYGGLSFILFMLIIYTITELLPDASFSTIGLPLSLGYSVFAQETAKKYQFKESIIPNGHSKYSNLKVLGISFAGLALFWIIGFSFIFLVILMKNTFLTN
ncbi:MAG TPA: hypothetical protein VIF12_06990 [Micavibrio sp.]